MWELAWPGRKQPGQGKIPELLQDWRINQMIWVGIQNESQSRCMVLPNRLMNQHVGKWVSMSVTLCVNINSKIWRQQSHNQDEIPTGEQTTTNQETWWLAQIHSTEPELGYYIWAKPTRELNSNPWLVWGEAGAIEIIPAPSQNCPGK